MKLLLQRITHFQVRYLLGPLSMLRELLMKTIQEYTPARKKLLDDERIREFWKRLSASVSRKMADIALLRKTLAFRRSTLIFLERIQSIGFSDSMDEYYKRKLGIFNLLNFFQLITGLIVPIVGAVMDDKLTLFSWYLSSLPAFISMLALALNSTRNYDTAMIGYFLLYPFFTSIVYMGGMNLGTELYFILYGILSVFFIQEISNMLFSVALSMISYFILSVVLNNYTYQLQSENIFLYIWNQLIAIIFIFYGLFLIKKENAIYQTRILAKNTVLENKNIEIRKQKREIAEKAGLLKRQTKELTDLNALKDKLFSVIAHDLKSPMYALQTLFRNIQHYDIPGKDIKKMIPDVVNDLNYTTGLMENLLQWAKSHMQSNAVRMQRLDGRKIMTDVVKLLRLQAEAKQITVEIRAPETFSAIGDRDMINLVLRNLLSNAIKFTPAAGHIIVGAEERESKVRFFVEDNGIGISASTMQKLNENDYYSTKGTASESGTGLGLMLCREFIKKNGSDLEINSIPNEGSTFSFVLDQSVEALNTI
ncbi:MAG: HAMP domain-containing histidine kinase [Chitinophagaceae bacterium]|nr:HAMP domain-containing histidine kinase [Chitinophagaceae bacterium]